MKLAVIPSFRQKNTKLPASQIPSLITLLVCLAAVLSVGKTASISLVLQGKERQLKLTLEAIGVFDTKFQEFFAPIPDIPVSFDADFNQIFARMNEYLQSARIHLQLANGIRIGESIPDMLESSQNSIDSSPIRRTHSTGNLQKAIEYRKERLEYERQKYLQKIYLEQERQKWQLVDEELEMKKINWDFPEDSELNQPNTDWEIIRKKSRKKKFKWELIDEDDFEQI